MNMRTAEPPYYQEFLPPHQRAMLLKLLQPELEALQRSFDIPPFPRFDLDTALAKWRPYPGLDERRRQEIEVQYDRINRRWRFRLERHALRAASLLRRRVPVTGVALDALKEVGAKRALHGFLGGMERRNALVPVSIGTHAAQPLITVAITCYEAEDTIVRAVESALAQTWLQREILVVDDGSTDRSVALLEELAQRHRAVRLIRHSANCGVAAARNTLLAGANGAFIAFFDDDDESAPHRLERQYHRIVEYESTQPEATVLCYSNRDVVRNGGASSDGSACWHRSANPRAMGSNGR